MQGKSQSNIYRNIVSYLKRKRVPEGEYSAKIIMETARHKAKHNQQEGTSKRKPWFFPMLKIIKKLTIMRGMHFPLQYLVGEWPFRHLNVSIRQPVLIPRFET